MTTTKTKPHKHRWYVSAKSGEDVRFDCRHKTCSEHFHRPLTKAEKAWWNKYQGLKSWRNPETNVHRDYHKFCDKFRTPRKDGPGADAWTMTGYALMTEVEKWAKRYPNVTIVYCDDSYNAGSMLVVLEHKAPKNYMGTTVIFIPQCTGEAPSEFFLYPEQRQVFIQVLKALDKPMKRAQKAAQAHAHQVQREWDRITAGPCRKPVKSS